MNSSRIVRGTKARIFLYVCVVLIVVGVIACYNSTLNQLDGVIKKLDQCQKQEEHLTTQLQVITDYKQRLEKSLKTEKAEQLRLKEEWEGKLNEEKSKHGKATNEANLHYNSLKQQYNLLQTEHSDYKEQCSNEKKTQLEEINTIGAKFKELQEQLKKEKRAKESLKSQYIQIQGELDVLKEQFNKSLDVKEGDHYKLNHLTKENFDLREELNSLKEKCSDGRDTLLAPRQPQQPSASPGQQGRQLVVGDQPPAAAQENSAVLKSPDKDNKAVSSSTPSNGDRMLQRAQPLRIPTVTPSTSKRPQSFNNEQNMVLPLPYSKRKVPQGIVPVPPAPLQGNEAAANDIIDNRYINKIGEEKLLEPPAKQDPLHGQIKFEEERENGAHENFEEGDGNDGMGFGDERHDFGMLNKVPMFKQHIDTLRIANDKAGKMFDARGEVANDIQEENEEDDENDDYIERRKNEDPAVRN